MSHGIYNSVVRDIDALRLSPFTKEIFLAEWSRREVVLAHNVDCFPIELLRIGTVYVEGSKPRLNVSDRDLQIKIIPFSVKSALGNVEKRMRVILLKENSRSLHTLHRELCCSG